MEYHQVKTILNDNENFRGSKISLKTAYNRCSRNLKIRFVSEMFTLLIGRLQNIIESVNQGGDSYFTPL